MTGQEYRFLCLIDGVYKEWQQIFQQKNADYGDSWRTFDTLGIMIRMRDKMDRCISIIEKDRIEVKTEALDDTIQDLGIYALMYHARLKEIKGVEGD